MFMVFFSVYNAVGGVDDKSYWINCKAGPFMGRDDAEQMLISLARNPNFRGGDISKSSERDDG